MRGMRVLAACSLGGAGHLEPLRPFLDAARHRGCETLVVGPPAIARMVEDTGHRFAACGEPPEDAVARIRERLPVVPAREASVLGNRELFGRLATAAMLPGMKQVIAEWSPDIVVRDPCEYASAVIAHQSGIPTAQVAIGLAHVERGSIDIAAPALEHHRSGIRDELHLSPYLTRFPVSLDPSPFPDTRRFREVAARVVPLPDWWNGSRARLVYVSFGTVLGHMTIAAATYRVALAAVGQLDARVLLTVGRRFDVAQLGEVPRNVHVEPWVDQADVLAEADVVVCHGGSGTTFGALGAGVPLVIVPLFADQFSNGAKVAEAGAGVSLNTGRDTDPAALAEAIETVQGNSSFREHARRIATEMARAPTVTELLDDLLGELTTIR